MYSASSRAPSLCKDCCARSILNTTAFEPTQTNKRPYEIYLIWQATPKHATLDVRIRISMDCTRHNFHCCTDCTRLSTLVDMISQHPPGNQTAHRETTAGLHDSGASMRGAVNMVSIGVRGACNLGRENCFRLQLTSKHAWVPHWVPVRWHGGASAVNLESSFHSCAFSGGAPRLYKTGACGRVTRACCSCCHGMSNLSVA